MNVSNRKCIRQLSIRNLKAAKSRNIIAIISIALTTVMFTSLFTILVSIAYGFEQNNFRQIGGYSHGGFKYLTEEQFNELKDDNLIKEYSLRRFVGMPTEEPFTKTHVEVSYCDKNAAEWMFCTPVEGRLPKENTNEAATDRKVLSLLGVEPQIGTEFTVSFTVDGKETTENFTLSGWWENDEASIADHILIPESRAEQIFEELNTKGTDGMTGTYTLDVMLKSKAHIEETLVDILERHGYQNKVVYDNFIGIGVNWGYLSSQLSSNIDFKTVFALIAGLALIVFTGYLIIYNVFNISVSNYIRRFGLLKTIGTTGIQIKRMVYTEALILSAIGIPFGLLLGFICGTVLAPIVASSLSDINSVKTANPFIFIFATAFSIVTVLISCMKPAKNAAKVSPVEAVRYTEGNGKKAVRNRNGGASILSMALANMGRSRSKTVVTIASMSLSVVLLCMTFIFSIGFDMDKYLSDKALVDYITANASYFQTSLSWKPLPEEAVQNIISQNNIEGGGRTYGLNKTAYEFVSEDCLKKTFGRYNSEETVNSWIESAEKHDGLLQTNVELYGMEKFCLEKFNIFEGDISKLDEGNYIAAVFFADDYGNIDSDSNWAKIGDKVTIRFVDKIEYYNPESDTSYSSLEDVPDSMPLGILEKEYHDVEYEVVALIELPHNLSYRFYAFDQFILGAENFKANTNSSDILYYAFDVPDDTETQTESFMSDFTQNTMPGVDYESKYTQAAEFESFRNMFIIMGGALSFITGLVGILNFLNAVLTGILARRHEFAVLQSVGMTGRQLKSMLVCEGLFYALGATVAALALSMLFSPLTAKALESMFWFFSYKFTVLPIVITIPIFTLLGVIIPLITYKFTARKSIVERLREVE